MNHKMKKMIATVLAFVLVFSFTITASAQENVGNGLILSAGTLTLTEGSSTVLVASMQEGFDASRLACVSANPGVATVTPVASMSNIANFQVNYVGNGSTVIAVYHMDNPAVVSYVTVNASPIVMEIPTKLGTNRDNYCTLTGYEFVPYEFHKYVDYSEVTTKGENGLTRVTQDIKYVNGVIQDLKIIKSDVLKAPVNEVVTKGTKKIQSYVEWTPTYSGDGNYAWPTLSPFVITSRFEYRWGSFHRGVDISGTGYGSPILSIADGVVYKTGFGSNEGNYIIVKHSDTLYSQYMHLAKIQCSAGQHVGKGQRIGSMGSTGFSTGTHLHLGIWLNAPPYQQGSSVVDPCRSVFRC